MNRYIRVPHSPYPWQQHVLKNLKTYNALVTDRQDGKTELATEIGASIIFSPNIKNPKWLIASDTIKRCYTLYAERLNNIFYGNPYFQWTSDKQSRFRIPRALGDTISIDIGGSRQNIASGKGGSYHYVLVDEYGQTMDGYFEENLAPTIKATNGIIIVTGTVEDNFWYDLFLKAKMKMEQGSPHWFCFYKRLGDEWSRKHMSQADIDKIKDKYNLKKEEDLRKYRKEHLCDWFSGSLGKIFARQMRALDEKKRIGDFKFNPDYKVGITIDDGHETAVWFFQLINGKIYFFKYSPYFERGMQDIAGEIRKWFKDNKAQEDLFIFPHTINKRSQSANMKTTLHAFMEGYGKTPEYVVVPKVAHIETKLDATRKMLDISHFDMLHCLEGLRSLRNYKRKTVRTKGIKTDIIDKENSHGAEAIGELALCLENGVIQRLNNKIDGRVAFEANVKKDNFSLWDAIERIEKRHNRKVRINDGDGIFGGY